GEPLDAQREAIEENHRESVHIRESAPRLQLTGRVPLDFEAYLELERAFEEILAIPRIPLGLRLLTQHELMRSVVKGFEAARLGSSLDGSLSAEELAAARKASDAELMRGLTERFRVDN